MQTPQLPDALRVVFPQWQACGVDYAAQFSAPLDRSSVRHGYQLGAPVLDALFPGDQDRTVHVPVVDHDSEVEHGIESRSAVLENLRSATRLIRDRAPERIVTLGGDCSVSVPSLTHLASVHGDDLAVVWLDSHPDCSTPGGLYQGYHDQALALITGHGDPEFLAELPATIAPERALLAGTHSWNEDEHENFRAWGISHLPPDELRSSPQPVIDWLRSTGCRKVVLHPYVDSVDSEQFHLGMGAEPGGLTKDQVQAVISAVSTHEEFDLVGITLGEFIPRQLLAVRELLQDVPLLR